MSWLSGNWHPICGTVYLFICLCDFVAMPVWCKVVDNHLSRTEIMLASKLGDSGAQLGALKELHEPHEWQPITLAANGCLHVSFAAILGVGLWARSRKPSEPNNTDLMDTGGSITSSTAVTTTAVATRTTASEP